LIFMSTGTPLAYNYLQAQIWQIPDRHSSPVDGLLPSVHSPVPFNSITMHFINIISIFRF
jgi:hypothetical protein